MGFTLTLHVGGLSGALFRWGNLYAAPRYAFQYFNTSNTAYRFDRFAYVPYCMQVLTRCVQYM